MPKKIRWKTAAPANEEGVFPPYRLQWLSRFLYGTSFEVLIVIVILANAIALAMLTIRDIDPEIRDALLAFDRIAFWIYVSELVARLLSYGSKPWMFFRSGWNIFDFLIIASAPFFQGQTAILRMLRLFRIIRILRFLPEVRVLTNSVIKSVPPLASLTVLIGFLLFLYAMTGHYMFGSGAPENWGDIGLSLQSLFILLTLENFPNYFLEAMEINPFALVYFLSFVFIIVFTVLNVLIGIVLNAMDQAREEDNAKTKEIKTLNAIEGDLDVIALSEPELAAEVIKIQIDVRKLKAKITQLAQSP